MGAFVFVMVTVVLPVWGIYWYMWGQDNRIIPKVHFVEVDGATYAFMSKKRRQNDVVLDYYLHGKEAGIPRKCPYRDNCGPTRLDGEIV